MAHLRGLFATRRGLFAAQEELVGLDRQFVLRAASSLPVCRANAAKSFTEPGSVANHLQDLARLHFGERLLGT